MNQMSHSQKCKFRYLVVLDFEATCDEPQNPSPQEAIEWPVMIVDTVNKCISKNKFHFYLKPMIHPNLTPFCTKLTGITQSMVNKGGNIFNVIKKWNTFCSDNDLLPDNNNKAKACMVTCGNWDLKLLWSMQSDIIKQNLLNNNSFKQILSNWVRSASGSGSGHALDITPMIAKTILLFYSEDVLVTPALFHSWINIKSVYQRTYHTKSCGMMRMLKGLNINHVGRHHSGIDDVQNISNIVLHMLKDNVPCTWDYVSNDVSKSNDVQIKENIAMYSGYSDYTPSMIKLIKINKSACVPVDDEKANSKCNRCNKYGHWARECPNMTIADDKCNRCGKYGHWAQDCLMKRNDNGNDKCHRCNKYGHWARDCPNMSIADDKCNRCGKYGHWAKDCLMKRNYFQRNDNDNDNDNDKCHRCHKYGHWARDCPTMSIADDKCHRCGKYGHWAQNCSIKMNKNNDKCNRCGKYGHWAHECPSRTGQCHRCGQSGHWVRECPN